MQIRPGICILLLAFIAVAWAVTPPGGLEAGQEKPDKGDAVMLLESGRLPEVTFPHHEHQAVVKDCNVCHRMFPREQGAIQAMQKKGTLEKKAVMNHCMDCHKEQRMAGKPSGPLSCTDCHPR